jgi:tRNA threonylcarbamoyladenosine biosynthesis protein TsaB
MGLILNIETATPVCSVCISKDEEIIAHRVETAPNSHASVLTVLIDDLFKSAKIAPSDLDAVAVSIGPGSYTGLRIGLSVAKGLCYALDKPLITVSTLQALANAIFAKTGDKKGVYLPMLDARRMDAYIALYNSALVCEMEPQFATITEELCHRIVKYDSVYAGGSALFKSTNVLTCKGIVFVNNIETDASFMAKISHEKLKQGIFADVSNTTPQYLKDFEGRTTSLKSGGG